MNEESFEDLMFYRTSLLNTLEKYEMQGWAKTQLDKVEALLGIYHGKAYDEFLAGEPLRPKIIEIKHKPLFEKLKVIIARFKYRHYNKYDEARQAKFDELEVSDNVHRYDTVFNAHYESDEVPDIIETLM